MASNNIYDVATLNKLVASEKALRDQAIAEKEGKQTIQTALTETYKPILKSIKESSEKQSTDFGREIGKIERKLEESKIDNRAKLTETDQILNNIVIRINRGNIAQKEHGEKLLKTIEDRPVLVELIKTVTPQLGKVLQGKADYSTLSKGEKQIFKLYDNLDDTSLKALIDYYAYYGNSSEESKAEISDEPHPADIAAMVREKEDKELLEE